MRRAYELLEVTRLFMQRVQLALCGTGLLLIVPACYSDMDIAIKGASMMVLTGLAMFAVSTPIITIAMIAVAVTRPGSRST